MNKTIVCTTPHDISDAIKKYDTLEDYNLIIIGDETTPSNYGKTLNRGMFIPYDFELGFKIEKFLPLNCAQRSLLGYLQAIKEKSDVIVTVSDDVFPYDSFGKNLNVGNDINITTNKIIGNGYYNYLPDICDVPFKIWQRGFPITDLNDNAHLEKLENISGIYNIGVQADYCDGDLDVDALVRLQYGELDYKCKDYPILIGKNVYSPFNNQSTFFYKATFPLMLLLLSIGRMDDIWMSYICQRIMWQQNYFLYFGNITSYHKRGKRDLLKDFNNEILGYKYTKHFLTFLQHLEFKTNNIFDCFIEFCLLAEELSYFPESFKKLWRLWISDIEILL